MLGPSRWVLLLLCVTQLTVGLLGNGFIGLVNGRSWLRSRRISLSDFIVTAMALSRIVLLWILGVDSVIMLFFPKDHEGDIILQVTHGFWAFTNHLSIWLATCLGVLYCLKIASFSHPTFLWLKWRMSRVVVWMLLGALVSSCGRAVSLTREFLISSLLPETEGTGNMTEHFAQLTQDYELSHVLGVLWNVPPLLVSLASYTLLVLSLRRHMQHMQQHRAGCRDASSEAHRRAIRMVLSFLVLFLLYFLAFVTASASHFLPGNEMIKKTGVVITMFYPAGHSFVLILADSRLKQTFMELLWCESGHPKPASKGPLDP